MTADLLRPAEIEVCGDVWEIRRTLDLARRVEQRLGAIPTLARRMLAYDVTVDQLVVLYGEILRGAEDGPGRDDIADWIWRSKGSWAAQAELAPFVQELVIGYDKLVALQEQKAMAAGGGPANPRPRPSEAAGPTASSTGPT